MNGEQNIIIEEKITKASGEVSNRVYFLNRNT